MKRHGQFAQVITHHPWCKLHYPIHVSVFTCPITEHCQVGLSFNRLKGQPCESCPCVPQRDTPPLPLFYLCSCFQTSYSLLAYDFMVGKSSFPLIRIAIRVVQCSGFNSKICGNANVPSVSTALKDLGPFSGSCRNCKRQPCVPWGEGKQAF